jgi:hypothetical protein
MPTYYFNVRNDDFTEDFEGIELADVQAAHAYAIQAARGLAADTVAHGHLISSHCIEIVDSERRSVQRVSFGEAVTIG